MVYGLVIAAGKQSRFETPLPKALMPVNEYTTLLDINFKNLQTVCDNVYVVCSVENELYFLSYPHITIKSGFGCGDAVMRALEQLPLRNNDTCFIQWGDSLHKESLYHLLKDSFKECMLIPCVEEDKPYVQIITRGKYLCKAIFSKYGEETSKGYHDLSLFYGNAIEILTALYKMQILFWNEVEYRHPHGNEMQFLDALGDVNLEAEILPVTDYKGIAFNTVEEYNSCINNVNCSDYIS